MNIDYRKTVLEKVRNKILNKQDEFDQLDPNTIKHVCVILTSSRGGSSVFKEVLTQSKDTLFLDGEEEPYFILTENGYPFNSDSDKIDEFNNQQDLFNLLATDIGKNIQSVQDLDTEEFLNFWRNRILLQTPQYIIDEEDEAFANTLIGIHNIIKIGKHEDQSINTINNNIIGLLKNSQFYDGFLKEFKDAQSFNRAYDSEYKIEEPPFVTPKLKTKPYNSSVFANKTLILKTPQDCYRINAIRKLFPQANIKFIHLTRNVAATVNGLIDGWQSDKAFFAHDVSNEYKLDIYDYGISNRWWKFDLPPNWREFVNSNIEDICINQWIYAHKSIYESIDETTDSVLRIKFEDFLQHPETIMDKVTDFLNIDSIEVENLPVTMATDDPEFQRWKRRKDIIDQAINKYPRSLELMEVLGYEVEDTKTWL